MDNNYLVSIIVKIRAMIKLIIKVRIMVSIYGNIKVRFMDRIKIKFIQAIMSKRKNCYEYVVNGYLTFKYYLYQSK